MERYLRRLVISVCLFVTMTFVMSPAVGAQKHEVFYEVNLRAISQPGDLPGAAARLPAIHKLGATIVWLMPIYPVGKVRSAGGMGSPYSVANYTQVNPEIGTLVDLKDLVRRAHRLHLKVILDWVANHTSWDNPWITQHKDWYRQDASGNAIVPPGTGWQDVAQLDHKNTKMRDEMTRAMEYWIDNVGVDGYRCDAADFVPPDFWQPLIAALRAHSHKKLIMLAEGSRKDHYQSGFDYIYAWDFCTALKEVIRDGKPASRLRNSLTKESGRAMMHYATNHDECVQASPVTEYGNADGAYVAFALAALYGGNPLVYNGEEISWPRRIPIFDRSMLNWTTGTADRQRYTALLKLIDDNPSLQQGAIAEFGSDDVIAFTRSLSDKSFLVLVNLRKTPSQITLPEGDRSDITLGPFEVRVTASDGDLKTSPSITLNVSE